MELGRDCHFMVVFRKGRYPQMYLKKLFHIYLLRMTFNYLGSIAELDLSTLNNKMRTSYNRLTVHGSHTSKSRLFLYFFSWNHSERAHPSSYLQKMMSLRY